ncbi:MAG TPA: glycogen debranching N-terminal domain-containing protein, partial [Ktedonobacteraceae bacterium]|nr:glycogen debranching N-terminal domain-containing protein [Ktedonobacteraceae bacterium]
MEKIVLKAGDAFLIANERGDLSASKKETGFFWHGTRFLSECNLLLAGQEPTMLAYTIADDGTSCHIEMMNAVQSLNQGDELLEGTIHVHRLIEVRDDRLVQTISLTNYHLTQLMLELSLTLDADFVDIFEVRGYTRAARGELFPPVFDQSSTGFQYMGLDAIPRVTRVTVTPLADEVSSGKVSWHIKLSKGQTVQIRATATVGETGVASHPPLSLQGREVVTSDPPLNQVLMRGMQDLAMLCGATPQGLYPYAGVPWFACPFGRDGLITSLQFLPWFPDVAHDTLSFLAAHQGSKYEAYTEEEPGKILHEFRTGEMANCREIPFSAYYGSIDATPLFLITLESYIRWSNDLPFLTALWSHAQAAAHWIKDAGDQDGDTFLESRTTSQKGLVNQGWKDSHDSISHANGALAEAPIALCEVQGYAYAAYRAMIYLAGRLGKAEEAAHWSDIAGKLQANFLQRFWWEEESAFYLALDGTKQPCAVVASNAGQCLWTGIVPDDLAQRVIERLLRDDMYSGWGIRTLSTQAARYNPLSYHNGSVWPHDVALVGLGFARYGRKAEASRLLRDLAQAGQYFDRARLPELFCGFSRSTGPGPIPYPVACEPQAWAAGAPFMLLNAALGLEPDAEHHRLLVRQPALPSWLAIVELRGLRLGGQEVSLRYERSGETTASIITR